MAPLSKKLDALSGTWALTRKVLVTRRDILRFVDATGDESFDQSAPFPLKAPPLFYQTMAFEDVPFHLLAKDGSPKEIEAPVPAEKTVGGSSQYEFIRRANEGEYIFIQSKLLKIAKKNGKSGDFYLVDVETRFTDDANLLVAREIATYVKR